MRKIIVLLLSVVLMLSLFAGCGSDSGSENTFVYSMWESTSVLMGGVAAVA